MWNSKCWNFSYCCPWTIVETILVKSKHLKQLWQFYLRVENFEKKESMLFFWFVHYKKKLMVIVAISFSPLFFVYLSSNLFCVCFFGFLINCDEEGTRIVRCSTKSKKKDDKKVLPLLALVLWLPPCHHLCHHHCTIRRNVRKSSQQWQHKKKKVVNLLKYLERSFVLCKSFAWSMKNHNLVANLLITLIFIHEFFNCKNIGLELFHLVYRWLKLCEGTYNGYKRYFSFLFLVLISIRVVVTMIILIFYFYIKGLQCFLLWLVTFWGFIRNNDTSRWTHFREQMSLLIWIGENFWKYSMPCHEIFLVYSFSTWQTLDDMAKYSMPCL